MINLTDRERELIEQICNKNKKGSAKKHSSSTSEHSDSRIKLVSNSSTKILVSKLERRLNETLNEVDDQKTGQITFAQLGRIFSLLDIFQTISFNNESQMELVTYSNPLQKQQEISLHEAAWKILSGGEERADIKVAFCFFRIILDPNYIEPSKSAELIKDYLDHIKDTEFDSQLITEFCIEFQLFQKTRLANTKIGYLKPQLAQTLLEQQEKTMTFKPALNPISEALQQQTKLNCKDDEDSGNLQISQSQSQSQTFELKDLARVEELYRKQDLVNKKKEFMRQEKLFKEQEECTFHPKVLSTKALPHNVVDRLYKVKDQKLIEERKKQVEADRENQEFSQCSFHPVIKYYEPELELGEVRGFEKTVQRIRTALDKKNLQEFKLNHKPAGERYEFFKNQPFEPPKMLNRNAAKKPLPALYIDVKLGPSKIGRLAIRENDNVQQVVQSFAKVWGVNQADYDILLTQVQQSMDRIKNDDQDTTKVTINNKGP